MEVVIHADGVFASVSCMCTAVKSGFILGSSKSSHRSARGLFNFLIFVFTSILEKQKGENR
jgi:hypothetical protein